MTQSITLNNHIVGKGAPCYLIAEVGTTCMGDVALAKQLVSAAAEAKMDAVKFQVIDPYQDVQSDAQYRVVWDGEERMVNMREMFERLHMEPEQWREVIDHCDACGITFLATCDYIEGIKMLETLDICAHKIGAWDTTYKDLIEAIGATGKPMIVDLGPTTQGEMDELIAWYMGAGGSVMIPLHDYHTNVPSQMNMHAVTHLLETLPGPVGYSSPNTESSLDYVALALGAQVIEKRLIASRSDQVLHAHESMEPAELTAWAKSIRDAEAAMGRKEIIPTDTDLIGAQKYYRSAVAARDIAKGATLSEDDIAYKRPGTGIAPKDAAALIGKVATTDIALDTLLSLQDVM